MSPDGLLIFIFEPAIQFEIPGEIGRGDVLNFILPKGDAMGMGICMGCNGNFFEDVAFQELSEEVKRFGFCEGCGKHEEGFGPMNPR